MLIKFFLLNRNLYVPKQKDIEFLKTFGKRLKQLREEKGISQAQLAFEAEIQISQISRIERGLHCKPLFVYKLFHYIGLLVPSPAVFAALILLTVLVIVYSSLVILPSKISLPAFTIFVM